MKKIKYLIILLLSTFILLDMSVYASELDEKQTSISDFTDVKKSDWFYTYVEYVFNNGLMVGTSDTKFGPNDTLTRAQFATILYRINDETVTYKRKFKDVPAGEWYSEAVTWASDVGVVSGYGNGLFGTNDKITREQMAAMMHRYTKYKGYDTSFGSSLDIFYDYAKTSNYAKNPISWAVGVGLISGKGSGQLDPLGSATRAECATIITKYDQTEFISLSKINTAKTQYKTILDKYYVAGLKKWDSEYLDNNGLNYICMYKKQLGDIGYAFKDVNNDGQFELFLGGIDEGGMFYDLYTIRNNQIKLIIDSAERDRYYLCKDNKIANEGSSSYNTTYRRYYNVGADKLSIIESVDYRGDWSERSPWFYSETDSYDRKDFTSISQQKATEIINKYTYMNIMYIPFTEYY